MQEHTGSLTRELDHRGVVQLVVTARPPTAPWVERIGRYATVVRLSLPVRRPRRLYAAPAAVLVPILGRRADVVHAHLGEDLAILPLAAMAAAPRALPVVITVHCSLAHTLGVCDARTAILRTVGGWLEGQAVRRAAATMVYTRRLADALARDDSGIGVHVVRRGVDRRLFSGSRGPDPFPALRARPRVVFVGRLTTQKGVGVLVEAASRMRTRGADVVLVGDGPARGAVERRIGELGLADRVHITGFVEHGRIPDVLGTADVLVLPSFYEELGSVLVEALHAGVPTVASRVGGIPEIVDDGITGLLVEPDDPDALAAAVDRILADRPLADTLRSNARRRAVGYDLERVAQEIHALYARVAIAERARPGRRLSASLWAEGPAPLDAHSRPS